MEKIVRHAFSGHDPREYAITSDKPSLTRQEFAQECDINVILARYQASGEIDFLNKHAPQYMDTTAVDFQTAMETVANAQSAFNDLPSHIRDRFENDPAKLLDFVHKDANREEAIKLGLIAPPAPGSAAAAVAGASAPPAAPAPATPPPASAS